VQLDVQDTPRLRLEPQTVAHADRLFDLFQDPALHRWTAKSAPEDIERFRQACAVLERRLSPDDSQHWFNWVSIHKDTSDIVGKVEVSIHRDDGIANLAYYTFRNRARRGFAREACQVVIDHVFADWSVATVVIEMVTENIASARLAEALEARRVSLNANAECFKGSWHDEYRYELQATPRSPRGLRAP
jgi:[ribosomal protein S5]-alanine N-acetyltransferase